jgi:hypothetical protein
MKEPHRLLEQGATEAERAVLGSACVDGPPDGAVERMMNALDSAAGNGAPGAQGPGHASGSSLAKAPWAAQSFKLAAWAKIGLLALVGLGGLVVGVIVYGPAGSRDAEMPAPTESAIKAPPAPTATPSTSQGTPLVAKPATATTGEMESTPRPQPGGDYDDSLRAELGILDGARAALEARNPAEARNALDSYAKRFPQGHLKPEAAVLRLAVLVRQGDRVAAKSFGRALLASDSYKTYEPRIRSLLREIPE